MKLPPELIFIIYDFSSILTKIRLGKVFKLWKIDPIIITFVQPKRIINKNLSRWIIYEVKINDMWYLRKNLFETRIYYHLTGDYIDASGKYELIIQKNNYQYEKDCYIF